MIKENQKVLNFFLVLLDWACLLGALLLASFFVKLYIHFAFDILLFFFLFWIQVLLLTLLFNTFGLYKAKRNKRYFYEFFSICYSAAGCLSATIIFFYLRNIHVIPNQLLLISAIFFIMLDGGLRFLLRRALRYVRKRGYNLKYLLLVGSGKVAEDFVRKVAANPQYGYRVAGCLTDSKTKKKVQGVPILGKTAALDEVLAQYHIDEVVLALNLEEYEKIAGIVGVCERRGMKVNLVPAFFQYIPSNPRMDEFDGMPVMVLRKIPLSNIWNAFVKRVFDIVFSSVALILSSPVILLASVLIRKNMGGTAIFKQERVGCQFKPFTMYKLRTMNEGNSKVTTWTAQRDSRRTRLGQALRRYSIDELPQFFNVLKGDMSVVGPRPELEVFVKQFQKKIPRYMVRHQVKPGITGWAQVNNLRGDTSIEERIKSDIYYIENWSLLFDIRIILRTALRSFYNPNE